MMNMMKKSAVAVGLAAALAGCVTSSGPIYHVDDPFLFFSGAGRAGGFPIVIVGQPYPGRQPGVEAAVADGFSRNFSSFPKPTITSTAPDARGQRLVVVFAPGQPLARDICRNANQMGAGIGGSAGDVVSASAVYCGGGDPFSSAWVTLPAPAGPETAEFRGAMESLIREAIPREIEPSRRDSGNNSGLPS